MHIAEQIIRSIRSANTFNPDSEVPPVCILWPDRERLWEGVVPKLQKSIEELFVFGEYDPDQRSGTALWLRCQVAKLLTPAKQFSKDILPIIYMPGISRQDLRIVQSCHEEIKLLIELQYRGKYWSQLSSKDWTPLAFLVSDHGGLGLDVAKDKKTKDAIQLCLPILIDHDIEDLRGNHIDAKYIYSLGVGDFPKAVLSYINEGETSISKQAAAQWASFCKISETLLSFNPHADGYLGGAKLLAEHTGAWGSIWERYGEAPQLYPNIADTIRSCAMPDVRNAANQKDFEGWPQYNDQAEVELQNTLQTICENSELHIREHLTTLRGDHIHRKNFIWFNLSMSPLLEILLKLESLSETTQAAVQGDSLPSLARYYEQEGWKADAAFLEVLNASPQTGIQQAVLDIAYKLYEPWAEASARVLQDLVSRHSYPVEIPKFYNEPVESKTCILFIDGLRLDITQRLCSMLNEAGYDTNTHARWAAFPSLTSTGKPAISPVNSELTGTESPDSNFYPIVTETGKSLEGGYHLKKLMIDSGWSILSDNEVSASTDRCWTEISDIDHEGHGLGWKIASHIDSVLHTVVSRIRALITAGWKQIHIVTDHGWLLLPGGLPKEELSSVLTENMYGRCAQIKEGALTDVARAPWYWNSLQEIAYASGVHAFKKGEEFTHGGLSLQESRVLDLTVNKSTSILTQVKILDVIWKGLRCNIETDAVDSDFTVDIRLQANIAETSVVVNIKKVKSQGTVSLVVEDESKEGATAYIVVVDETGSVIAQQNTIIGD